MRVSADTPPEGTVRDWLDHRARLQGDRAAYLFFDGHDALNWRDLRDQARKIAGHLTASGIAKGESVAIMLPNGRDVITSLFGALYGGFRATIINLVAGDEAIGYALAHCEARFAIAGPEQQEQFAKVKSGRLSIIDLQKTVTLHEGAILHDLIPQDQALLMYTSGTTGRPKGVVHTHASLLAGGWTTALAHALSEQDRGLCVLPIYHINGLCVTVMGALVSSGSLAIAPKFSAGQFWDQCSEAKITWYSVVPTIISHLLHGDTDPTAETRDRIRFGRSASSALAPDVQTAFETRFGMPIVETMGLTETAAQILSNPLPPGTRKIGSPGRAFGNEVCILSPELTTMPPNQQGEIAVRGPNVMVEYLKNPKATTETFAQDGWLRTGDLGHMDEDGYFFITGRLKELIIKGGENIAPREIDEALYSHADVIEAAAFARPCKIYGERVEAAVRVRDGSALTAKVLSKICIKKLGKFKSPDRVHFLDELPKGPSGKIQRLKLAEMLS
mgnify:FL=1